MKILYFFVFSMFVGQFALLNPDTDPANQINADPMRIRIHNPEYLLVTNDILPSGERV
jgi:hypothetical protein